VPDIFSGTGEYHAIFQALSRILPPVVPDVFSGKGEYDAIFQALAEYFLQLCQIYSAE
jgi:hypothetical protein